LAIELIEFQIPCTVKRVRIFRCLKWLLCKKRHVRSPLPSAKRLDTIKFIFVHVWDVFNAHTLLVFI
jgi:hypothetical protein